MLACVVALRRGGDRRRIKTDEESKTLGGGAACRVEEIFTLLTQASREENRGSFLTSGKTDGPPAEPPCCDTVC